MFFLITFMNFSRTCSKCWPTSPLSYLLSHGVVMLLQQRHSKTWWRPYGGCSADAQRKCTDILDSQLRRLTHHSSSNAIGNLKSESQPKTLQASGTGSLGIRVIITRAIWVALAQNSNGRPRIRTRHTLRKGIIFSLWPCFACFYAVPLAPPFLFQV